MPELDPADASLVTEIDRKLEAIVRGAHLPVILEEAVLYTLKSGGKRIRPRLTIMWCQAHGGTVADAIDAAAAMELVHTFSLVHDDLPAMDDDDVRRGRPTLHVHAGEAMAILAGDVMMSIASTTAAESVADPARANKIVLELMRATSAMIAGQVLDTVGGFPHELNPAQRLGMIDRNKTGALIRAACCIGAHCAGASDIEPAERYGSAIGLMFQVVDDLLDVTQSAEHVGKATRKDEAAGKYTWPGIHGLERSREEIDRLAERAIEAVDPLGSAGEPLVRFARDMATRTR